MSIHKRIQVEKNTTTNNEHFQNHEDIENNVNTAKTSINMQEDFGRPTTSYSENRKKSLPPYSSNPWFSYKLNQIRVLYLCATTRR